MDEDQGRASPPLPSKGSYNIDFDALDDSFNPFASKAAISSSPPLGRKNLPANGAENLTESAAGGDDGSQASASAPKEPSETPKKKKTKSKKATAVTENEGSEGVADLTAFVEGLQDASAAVAADVADKPVKTKKVVKKPKSRPVSKNLEPKSDGQGTPEKPLTADDSAANTTVTPPETNNTCAASPQDNCIQEDTPVKPHPDKTPEQSQQPHPEDTPVDKNLPDKSPSLTDETTTPSDQQGEKSLQEEAVTQEGLAPPETTLPREKSPKRHSDKSSSPSVGEEGVEGSSSRKEKSSGKVKKSKTKVKKSRHSGVEGDGDGGDAISEKDRDSKASSRVSSHGDAAIAYDSAVDTAPVKTKHPASRVLEQQLQVDQLQPLAKGESDMADSHSTESVVKLVQVLKYSQSDWNKLRQELELNFQAQMLAKEKEWGAKLADRDARLATLDEGNKKLRQTNDDMRAVMGEFEKTIGQLQSEKEKTSNASQQSLQDVVKERDQALEDLQSVETAFSDLHRRYEKTKGVVDGFKQNEEVLKKCVQDLQNKLKKTEQKIQAIKEQAEEKLERATEEIEKTKKSSASEIARLEAALRKADLQVQSMESTLEQKVKENKELAAICDELIAKVQ